MRKIDLYSFKKKEFVIKLLLYFVFFLFLIHAYRDYDWGWHYRYGEYFVKTGKILMADPFSWTLPGYIWVNHSWLFDPLLYILYSFGGFTGLTIAGALVTFIAFIFGVIDRKLSYLKLSLLMLFFANISSGVIWQGLRSQMVGFLLLSVFLFILRKLDSVSNTYKKYYYLGIPLLFLLWVNFHGYFLLGLVCFGISIFSDIVLHIKEIKKSQSGLFIPKDIIIKLGVFILSFTATFINPFTYHVYLESFKHFRSPLLGYIQEWIPVAIFTQFYFVFFLYSVVLLIGFLWRRNMKLLKWFLISLFVYLLASGARRYMAVFAVASLPLAAMLFESIPLKIEKYKTTFVLFIIAILISLEIAFFRRLPSFDFYSYGMRSYCALGSKCSEGLITFLLDNPPKGRGLNYYDWGGYLIGRKVPTKLFIDGRMHLWQKEGEIPIFQIYQNMYYEKNYDLFTRLDFDWYIGEVNSDLANQIRRGTLGYWITEYQDDRAVYMVRDREKERDSMK